MDEGLRRAEREDDWEQRAAALRRAGQTRDACRVVQVAAWRGDLAADEALERCFPLAGEQVLFQSWLRPGGEQSPLDPDLIQRQTWAASALVGDGDPRLDALLRAFLANPRLPARLKRTLSPVSELLGLSVGERVLSSRGYPGWLPDLVDLPPDELLRLGERTLEGGSSLAKLRLAAFLEGSDHEGVPSLQVRMIKSVADPLWRAAIELVSERAQPGQGRGGARPDWVRPAFRDPRTGALSAGALRPVGAPFGAFVLPECEWIALFDLDRANLPNLRVERGERLCREVTAALQHELGDRVVAWAQDRWLVPWTGDDAEERLELARTALSRREELAPDLDRVTLSAGLTRLLPDVSDPLPRVEVALSIAIEAGRDRLEVR